VLIDSLRSRGLADSSLLDRTEAWLAARMPLFETDVPVLLHGDVHFNNLMWDGTDVTVLDFEGATKAVLPVLKANYPALFAVPDLDERLNVDEAMSQLLQLHHFPPGHRFDPVTGLEAVL